MGTTPNACWKSLTCNIPTDSRRCYNNPTLWTSSLLRSFVHTYGAERGNVRGPVYCRTDHRSAPGAVCSREPRYWKGKKRYRNAEETGCWTETVWLAAQLCLGTVTLRPQRHWCLSTDGPETQSSSDLCWTNSGTTTRRARCLHEKHEF